MKQINQIYVNGQFVKPHGRTTMDLINPSTKQVIGQVTLGDEKDTQDAIAAAKAAFHTFSRTSIEERSHMLQRLHDVIIKHADELNRVAVEEYGSPVTATAGRTQFAAQTFLLAKETLQDFEFDRYELIASYLQTLLLQVNRLYAHKAAAEPPLAEATHHNDQELITRFRNLITREIAGSGETPQRSVAHYAKELAIHPNHLNVVAKRTTGHNALQIIHEQLINTSKTRLLQTTLSVKELAYQLAFKEPTHFVSFFKKHTKLTPLQFREQEKGTAF
jgi:AraC-like DNA-binding protein